LNPRDGKKRRLDQLLNETRPDLSRSRIQAEIMAGRVLVDGKKCDKPGQMVGADVTVTIIEPQNPYVSRGGLKLAGALHDFALNVEKMVVLDVGASTGGFTDCLLKKGASLVYALDVGYGQLDYSLRNDPRVINMERFNIRNLDKSQLSDKPDLCVIDVSFISLSKIFPLLSSLEVPSIIALVKPQFEVGRAEASKGAGVIRDPALQGRALQAVLQSALDNGYSCKGITFSKLKGPKGNIEFFIYLQLNAVTGCGSSGNCRESIQDVVRQAHRFMAEKKI
jgi:23S rRNA (cytidine1920-2'-O)/16S rRNA (cytidine1409-2'-O)-methyltransferase